MSEGGFTRDSSEDDHQPGKNVVDKEVAELIKSKATDYEAWRRLESKYGSKQQDLINNIMEEHKKKMGYIYKKVRKFKDLLINRYNTFNLNHTELIAKAKKYQRKYKLSDDEFDMFIILLKTDTSTKYAQGSIPTSNMAKTLGYDDFLAKTATLSVKPDEVSTIEEIVNLYGITKPLHAQIVMQSLTYEDCGPEALVGKFDPAKHNAYSHVNTVIAALFVPKIKLFDERMLMANIGYIVSCKSKSQRIQTLPDFNLYWSMISDPNDVACHEVNAVQDLKNRFILQTQIWDAVMNLRQGKYYYLDPQGLAKFMTALENCRNIIHDAPDLTYIKDEGTILRRILSAFSLYPTYVSVNRMVGLMTGMQFGYPSSPMEVAGFSNITRIPMVTLRLPLKLNTTGNNVLSLEDALVQPQWFVENKVIVPKSLQIIHSNDCMIFYVGRRYQTINIARMAMPYNFTNLPMTISGIESVNTYPVNAPRVMDVMNDRYLLRSVVCVETTKVNNKDIIVGSSTMIVRPRDILRRHYDEICYYYNPQRASIPFVNDPARATYHRDQPITIVPSDTPFNPRPDLESFEQKAMKYGTIFIYKKITSNTSPFYDASGFNMP
jgi:hypothetical protein